MQSNQGTIYGSTQFADGVNNKAINLTLNARVCYPISGRFNDSNGTIEFWALAPNANSLGYFDIGSLGNPNSWGIYKNVNYAIMEVKNNVNSYSQAWSPNSWIYDGMWHFVAATWKKSGTSTYFKICLDGNCKTSYDGVRDNTYPNLNGNFCLGWCGWYGYSKSLIDEVKIFNYEKTNQEIKADYDAYKDVINKTKKTCQRTKPDSKGNVVINCSGLYVNGNKFIAKGVGYQPIPIGKTAQSIPDKQAMYNDPRIYRDRDFPLLRNMNANTVRTWSEVLNSTFLDAAWNNGIKPIYVLMGFWINCNENYGDAAIRQKYKDSFAAYVTKYKDYPAVLAWGLGNENNLGYCSNPAYLASYNSLCNELAQIAYTIEGDRYHPVGIINGGTGTIGIKTMNGDDDSLNYTDFWGSNVYNGNSFGQFFDEYSYLTGKPLLITEYGTDALNDSSNTEMEQVQSDWNLGLWREIAASPITFGGTVMAYSDEWWKGAAFGCSGTSSTHEYHCGHGDFPTPDGYSNEEWFGVVRVRQNTSGAVDIVEPRQVYYDFKQEWSAPADECVIPENNMVITQNTVVCPGIYNFPNGISINEDDIVLDCNNALFNGTSGNWSSPYIGIYMQYVKNITIRNCQIQNYGYGIAMINSTTNIIDHNNISGIGYGIYTDRSNNTIISDNIIDKIADVGITFSASGASYNYTIKNNIMTNSAYLGINFYCYNCTIISNKIMNNKRGISVSGQYNNITYNDISNSSDYGLIFWAFPLYSHASYNNISNNQFGIYFLTAVSNNKCRLSNNLVTNNIKGIYFSSRSSNNTLYENKICKNSEYDIFNNNSQNFGADNKCGVAFNWNDADTFSCRYSCEGSYKISKGWNLFAASISPVDQTTNRTILLNKGWNLLGYSSESYFDWNTALINNKTATKTLINAGNLNWIQPAIYYFNESVQNYGVVIFGNLTSKKGYWLYALKDNLTLILPNVGGSLQTNSFDWLSAKIIKGTETKSISDAESFGWLQSTLYYYDKSYKFVPGDDSNVYPWKGYWLYSNYNLTLII